MEESRRGFLKRGLAVGSLLVPLGATKPEVVKETSIIELPTSQSEPVLDLGDCLIIPKIQIRGWSFRYSNEPCLSASHTKMALGSISEFGMSLEIELSGGSNPNWSHIRYEDKDKLILPYGTLEY